MNSHIKSKSASKVIIPPGEKLERKVLDTMETISSIVGSTLGPSGSAVLLERQDYGFPNILTKDGVTVFKYLGFKDPVEHCIMESARDAAVRTATEAGDGPQPLYSRVLTPNGFVTMGSLRAGMKICGTNGSIQEVIEVYRKGMKEIFEVTFSEGRVVECCEDHVWSVTTSYGSTKTLSTKEILKDFKSTQNNGYTSYRYFTPRTDVEFNENKKLPLDPYLVGVLLGDGSLRDSGSIEISLGKNKEHILNKLILPKGIFTKTSYHPEKNYFRVKLVGESLTGDTIRNFIDKIGLKNVKSDNKFIPEEYLFTSKETRKSLLQGLLDTDGHINKRGRFEFSTISLQLANDFVFLARSLGKSLHVRKLIRKKDNGSYSDKDIYRITELKGDMYGNKITNVVPTKRFTEMQCIKVSNPDNLYITDNFIVTHNTTTATVLAEAIVRNSHKFCKETPFFPKQKVVRELQHIFKKHVEPLIKSWALKPDRKMLTQVANISVNGETELANIVMECFDKIGDDGNVSITEMVGPSHYEVEFIEGYPLATGYEESCGSRFQLFLNDSANNRCLLENPVFVLYYGAIGDIQTVRLLMEKIGAAWENPATYGLDKPFSHNVVLIANGYSDDVINHLAANFVHQGTINVVPLKTYKSPVLNGEYNLLHDLSAITGAKVFDPITYPLDKGEIWDLGQGVKSVEINRYRTTIVGISDDGLILARAEEIREAMKHPESQLDLYSLQERISKLTNGIAKLKIYGASSGETREKRDRAEDATYSVRGARKHGCLPGGGWTLLKLVHTLSNGELKENPVFKKILAPSFNDVVDKLLANCGMSTKDISLTKDMINEEISKGKYTIFNGWTNKSADALEQGILDSVPAVLEAIRSSVSIAGLLGTLGGLVVYERDVEMERREASLSLAAMRDSGS